MAETIITPDGKVHTLMGSTNEVSLIREYAGDELADWVLEQIDLAEELAAELYSE